MNKEDIVESRYNGVTEYSFRLLTNGAILKDNLLYYEGKETARLGDIMIFDSDGQADIGSIKSETVKEGYEYLVTVCVNDGFMKDAVYPVYIDPSVFRIDTETINGTFEDNGIILVNTNEVTTESAYYRTFLATEYSSSSYRPYITFTYTPAVTLSATEITIPVGGTYQLYATLNPPNTSYYWSSIQWYPNLSIVSNNTITSELTLCFTSSQSINGSNTEEISITIDHSTQNTD